MHELNFQAHEPCQHEQDFLKTEKLNDKNSEKLTKLENL